MFEFLITNKEKGHDPQILLPGRIYYNFVPSTKSEDECREDLIHLIVKAMVEF